MNGIVQLSVGFLFLNSRSDCYADAKDFEPRSKKLRTTSQNNDPNGPFQVANPHNITLSYDNFTVSSDGTSSPDKYTNKHLILHDELERNQRQAYEPGNLFYERESNLYLSKGLRATRFGRTGDRVLYPNGRRSSQRVHDQPDAGACFDTADNGGFVYVSNEEVKRGGVGAFKFNGEGEVVDYKMILKGTKRNCGGGKTPWGTWVTGEEAGRRGFFYEVHPTGKWSQKTKIVVQGGNYESAAFDDRDMRKLKVFGTNDKSNGELTRFAPNPDVLEAAVQSGDYRKVLTSHGGSHDYLVLEPTKRGGESGTFRWSTNKFKGRRSARRYFPHAEGIDHHDGTLFFVSKKLRRVFVLDLDRGTYTQRGTSHGTFNGQPDQILHAVDPYNKEGLIYFTEDGGKDAAGIYVQDMKGRKFTVMKGGKGLSNESTGFAICDRGTKIIVAFQDEGFLYLIRRQDGKGFGGNPVDLKYHNHQRKAEKKNGGRSRAKSRNYTKRVINS